MVDANPFAAHDALSPSGQPGGSSFMSEDAAAPVAFSGDGKSFIRLCVRGALLQLVTFGFYRFWLVTDIRKLLWTGVSAQGEALEYTGKAKELLIGFFIALAIYIPIGLVYFFVTVQASALHGLAAFPLALFFILFGQFILYRARLYRLSRTVWRGIRFWVSGSGWYYAGLWLLWSLLTLLTLGLAYPWMCAALERYKIENTHFGDLRGSFEGTGAKLFKVYIRYWCSAAAAMAILVFLGALTSQDEGLSKNNPFIIFVVIVVELSIGLLYLFFLSYFRAATLRWWAAGIRFGDVKISTNVKGSDFLKLFFKYIGTIILAGLGFSIIFTIFAIIAGVILYAMGGEAAINDLLASSETTPDNDFSIMHTVIVLVVIPFYILSLVVMGVIYRYFFVFRIWKLIMTKSTLYNLHSLENVLAAGNPSDAVGEGLSETLDIGGF